MRKGGGLIGQLNLPSLAFLLAYDLERGSAGEKDRLEFVVRGAALAELAADGYLYGVNDEVFRLGEAQSGDGTLDLVLEELDENDPRTWKQLVQRGSAEIVASVEDDLVGAGLLETALDGSFAVAQPGEVRMVQTSIRASAIGEGDPNILTTQEAILGSIAAVVPLTSVLSRKESDGRKRSGRSTRSPAGVCRRSSRCSQRCSARAAGPFSAGGPVH